MCRAFARRDACLGLVWVVGYYRLHYLDGFRGDVRVREFEAENDEAAIAYGDDVRSLSQMELWQGDRRVRHWDSFPPTATDD